MRTHRRSIAFNRSQSRNKLRRVAFVPLPRIIALLPAAENGIHNRLTSCTSSGFLCLRIRLCSKVLLGKELHTKRTLNACPLPTQIFIGFSWRIFFVNLSLSLCRSPFCAFVVRLIWLYASVDASNSAREHLVDASMNRSGAIAQYIHHRCFCQNSQHAVANGWTSGWHWCSIAILLPRCSLKIMVCSTQRPFKSLGSIGDGTKQMCKKFYELSYDPSYESEVWMKSVNNEHRICLAWRLYVQTFRDPVHRFGTTWTNNDYGSRSVRVLDRRHFGNGGNKRLECSLWWKRRQRAMRTMCQVLQCTLDWVPLHMEGAEFRMRAHNQSE